MASNHNGQRLGHHDGDFYLDKAQAQGFPVRNGGGRHVVIELPPDKHPELPAGVRPALVVPRGEISRGVEHNIVKWFKVMGILLALILGMWVIL